MDHSLLPEGSVSKSLRAGWEGSATTFPTCLRVLEGWQIAANHLLICCSLPAVGAAHQMMFISRLRSWVMTVPRMREDSTVSTVSPPPEMSPLRVLSSAIFKRRADDWMYGCLHRKKKSESSWDLTHVAPSTEQINALSATQVIHS